MAHRDLEVFIVLFEERCVKFIVRHEPQMNAAFAVDSIERRDQMPSPPQPQSPEWWVQFTDDWTPRIVAQVLPWCGRREDAEDIAQEVFLILHSVLTAGGTVFTTYDAFGHWLRRVARRQAIRLHRQKKARKSRQHQPIVTGDSKADEVAARDIEYSVSTPDERAAACDLREKVLRLTREYRNHLPPQRHRVLCAILQILDCDYDAADGGDLRRRVRAMAGMSRSSSAPECNNQFELWAAHIREQCPEFLDG